MSKLDDIKTLWNENNDPCNPDDYEWLIQQAERVEELEKDKNEFMKWWQDEVRLANKYMDQSQRYKKVLEDIFFFDERYGCFPSYEDCRIIIEEALKEGESE